MEVFVDPDPASVAAHASTSAPVSMTGTTAARLITRLTRSRPTWKTAPGEGLESCPVDAIKEVWSFFRLNSTGKPG